MSRVILVEGQSFTGKTTFAGSGSGLKWYAEFDQGSFRRANFKNRDEFEVHYYQPPLESLLEATKVSVKGGKIMSQDVRQVVGAVELMTRFREDLFAAASSRKFSSFIYDTDGILWERQQAERQQEISEAGFSKDDTNQMNFYTECNRRMFTYLDVPGMVDADMVLVSHEKEVYNQPGMYKADGWKHAPGRCDCIIRFTLQGQKPVGTIQKGGAAGLDLTGIELPEPTLPKLHAVLDAAEVIRRYEETMPKSVEEILKKAKVLES